MRFTIYSKAIALVVLALFLGSARADEGMWDYTNLPTATLQSKYGFTPTPAWTEHLMKSSVRFNSGGSGSFVSSTGLVLTNHHVGADTLHKISTPQHDYYANGFYAKTLAEEVPAPDLELNQLVAIVDVTARVNAAVRAGMAPAAAAAARKAVIAEIENESFRQTGLRSDVVTLYQGGRYHLYRYKKYTDVRLVFAPEFSIAFFGGDPDNFTYPRYDLDMTLFRVYENGRPAKIDHYLKWSAGGAADRELVFVSGNPGRTSRLFTVAALQFLRDNKVPYTLEMLKQREAALLAYMGRGTEENRRGKEMLFGVQNSRKAYIGMLGGLQDPTLIEGKRKAENALRLKVATTPKLQALSDAWDTVEDAVRVERRLLLKRALLEQGHAFNSQLFTIARTLVRLAEENTKPNGDRLTEYRDSNRASLEQELFSTAPVYADLEQATLTASLEYLVTKWGAGNAQVKEILAGKTPAERAAELVNGTALADVANRKAVAAGGAAAIATSTDPMILLAKLVDPPARSARKDYETLVEEPQRQGYARIAEAIFALQGTSQYPDATFTLRLSFGEVKGYRENGQDIPPYTLLGGAFDHEAKHGAKEPYLLPSSWHQAKPRLNLGVPFNFVSTADIIGGNSGSPVVNRAGELVGLIFDGNIQSLTADYAYSEVQSRAVAVHSAAIQEAMRVVYGAGALADELGR